MNNNRPRNASRTTKPEFWELFYWGNGGLASEEICKNRDNFYKAFIQTSGIEAFIPRLKKAKKAIMLEKNHHNKQTNNEFRDHTEYYEIDGSKYRVIVFHPYYISNENIELVKANGFNEIKPMYASNAKSFMKIVDSVAMSGLTLDGIMGTNSLLL